MAAYADFTREKTHWSAYEVQVLLTLWADSSIQQELESTVRNERVYSRITTELAAVGIHRSIKQCREKIKKLKQQYKKLKDHNKKSDAEWYVTMDSVLGHRQGSNFACDVTYYGSDTAMENKDALASTTDFGPDSALLDTVSSVENGYKTTMQQAVRRWNSQRRRILFKAKQAALRRRALHGRNGPAASHTTRWERQARREPHTRQESDVDVGTLKHQCPATETHEEDTTERHCMIKTETEECVVSPQKTDVAPLTSAPIPMLYEEGQAHSTTQDSTAVTVQHAFLTTQREQCRLMTENNGIQRTLVRAVSRNNRCISDLAKSIRAQTAVAASVQDRIVQLLERQEWTNQLLTMKVMGVSSTPSERPQEARGESARPSTVPQSVCSDHFSGKEATELSPTSATSDQ
ncbi:uncharacterized protein LOC118793466 [Megalops cyprinoides]|uniref:uncharacterized protein LOC118793466 n=1 Tax=Megalops cyprinoides TaxID=118141 RepID=UPI0018653BB2|nr:uncharacterized protein LOC118793466 [Megalops cyprinoides]